MNIFDSWAKVSIFCENAKGFDLFLFVFADKSRETAENICMIQKNGHTDTMEKMLRRLELDLYYLEHRSWWFDTKILVKTFINIVFGNLLFSNSKHLSYAGL